ncbi:MAG: cell surface protein SprA [Candidatus Cyclobacteriaceae bacterium M3_2C_046]
MKIDLKRITLALLRFNKILIFLGGLLVLSSWISAEHSGQFSFKQNLYQVREDSLENDTTARDSLKAAQDSIYAQPYKPSKAPTYQPKDRFGDPFTNDQSPSPLLLKDPSTLKLDVEIDTGMNYTIYEKMGDINYRPTSTMSFEEFSQFQQDRMLRDYWKNRSLGLDGESAVSGRRLIPPIYISPFFDRIFGGSYVDIRPNGFVTLDFGGRWQRLNNPSIPIRQQRNGGFEFDQQISMNVVGKIGEKLSVLANFDNNNSFDFENDLKVEYTGFDEEIIKKIEIGNVSLPLNNSLITGAQSLFGVKTQLQFGRLFVTGVASTQRGKTDVIEVESGSQGSEFQIRASEYDENRHFFLGHYFRDNYDINGWLRNIPQIISGLNITRVEVYVVNRNQDTENRRNIVAFMDLGEGRVISQKNNPLIGQGKGNVPNDNNANQLFESIKNNPALLDRERVDQVLQDDFGFVKGRDYEIISPARKLDEKEYVFNRELGFLSLFRKLQNDEALAVSYEYTYRGQKYKVGELMEDYANRNDNEMIFLKLLRPQKINLDVPTWDLMMKNIYNLNASQISREGFQLRVQYRDDNTGIDNPSLHEGRNIQNRPLVEVFGLDRLNQNLDQQPDGNFDFIEGITILPENGQIIFPVKEPFGNHLRSKFDDDEVNLIKKYVYDTLYNTTKADAELVTSKNKFFIVGQYQAGSARDIMLPGINIAENSVRVLAGNTPLLEGVDYRVDYTLGKVTIINDGILSSGKKIRINYEKADLFNFQTRNLLGTRLDYRVNDDFNLGATMLYVNERPLISRVSIGDEPTRNLKYGMDVNYRSESRFLTKMVDALPFISTKEPSNITLNAEFAQLRPGTSNKVRGEGASYLDDFEATRIPFNLGNNILSWQLASTPKTDDGRFTEGPFATNELGVGFRRAKVAWYIIDNVFYRKGGRAKPSNITEQDNENFYVRPYLPQDIFKGRDNEVFNAFEPIFDVAYYPHERGQYNYNPNLTFRQNTPLLNQPEENWGGITRAITSDVDFDKNNIEFIEFWMMDPFLEGENGRVLDGIFNQNNTTGGELYFNLGSISEDVIKDGRHGFENGLPAGEDGQNQAIETSWGRVTTEQFLTNAFDNSPTARENQDVGMDGFDNAAEKNFDNYPAAVRNLDDPSADDFQYYLGADLDAEDKKILERYKNFNGMDGNSPASATDNALFTPSGSNLPDNEDLNDDNTLTDLEEYYEYRLNLKPGQLDIGRQHIVDKVNAKGADWYLFRIPIRQPDRVQGDIQGFKSIRYIRMFMTGFSQPVVLRFAKFQLIGTQWRKFNQSLDDGTFRPIQENNQDNILVSVVNREENGETEQGSQKIPYKTPPGINPDRDITSPIVRFQNEQAIQICVEDLKDRDRRAIFKNVNFDLINYKQLKMFLHAQSDMTRDDELTAFIRLGTDFTENYYEIEVPLKITPPGSTASQDIWPSANEIDIKLDWLNALKAKRNRETGRYTAGNSTEGLDLPFSEQRDKYTLTVEGNPDLSAVQTIMIGIRNPHYPEGDDELPKSACIWANELRVSEFDNNPGWAANARVNAKLADFANVTASTRYSSFGFGGIQERIAERSREEITEFDVTANVNLDKMLPENTGLKIPMYASYETSTITPQFDPRDPDITLNAALQSYESATDRAQYRSIVEDRAVRRSINFTNVRKVKIKEEARSHLWDIENFSVSYAYSDIKQSGFYKESYLFRSYRGNLSYNYNPEPVVLEPFKNSKLFASPWLGLIKDFNLSLLPSNLSFRADLDRRFVKTQLRNSQLTTAGIDPNFEKYFTFNRNYNLRWNLTQNLSLDYSARTNAIIDEPEGDINTQAKKDSIWNNIKSLGRMKNFSQMISANYRVPLDKFPLTDWVSADAQYSVGYTWTAGTLNQEDSLGNFFGHMMQNNRQRGLNGKFDLVKLYNKVKFLKEVNSPPRRRPNRPAARNPQADTVKQVPELKFLKGVMRTIMAVRSVNFTYGKQEGTILPGFTETPFLFGMDQDFSSPGWDFVLGSQDPSIRYRAARNNWITLSPFLSSSFSQISSEDFSVRANIEPFSDMRIQLDMKKTKSENYQELFVFDSLDNDFNGFNSLSPSRMGSYSISFLPIQTAFIRSGENEVHPVFELYDEYRSIIRNRLNAVVPGGEYREKAQDVLIPAFLAAYTGQDPDKIALSPFPRLPMFNWRLDYRGLTNLAGLDEYFSSINISHSYNALYSVNGYTSSLEYQDGIGLNNSIEDYPLAARENDNGDLVPYYVINQVVISERFNPLIQVDVSTKSRVTGRIAYRTERNLALNMMNSQVTELNSNDISFQFGFTKANLRLPFKVEGETIVLENDLTFKLDFTIRDTQTIQRSLAEPDSTGQAVTDNKITSGNINFQLRPTINYVLNQRLNMSLYFERNINEPKITNSFPRRTTAFGVQIRFSLAQ